MDVVMWSLLLDGVSRHLSHTSVFIKMSVKVQHVMVVMLKKGSCRNNAITAICCQEQRPSTDEQLY